MEKFKDCQEYTAPNEEIVIWQKKVGAVIVAYLPDKKIFTLLESIISQFDHIIICDNGIEGQISVKDIVKFFPNVEIIDMYGNKGIGYALNRGIERLNELKFDFLITFDQDTETSPGFVQKMLHTYRSEINKGVNVGIIAPVYKDRNTNEYSAKFIFSKYGFSRNYSITGRPTEVTMVITSGSLSALSLYESVGRYIEDMFIDYVDNEFCLRLFQAGFKVLLDDNIVIEHSLGERNLVKFGFLKFSPTNHSVIRKYYISRNRLYCIKRYGFMLPGFVMFEILAFTNDLIRITLFEAQKKHKLGHIFKGLKDGLTFSPRVEYRIEG